VNYVVNGIRFRDSYAVVEKDSKTYRTLMQIPVLKGAMEYPLIFLRKLRFVTRPLDIKMIYGADVYSQYIRELEKDIAKEVDEKTIQEEIKHVVEEKKCAYKTDFSKGSKLCKEKSLDISPSGYCTRHILMEPQLEELGIIIPKFITKVDKPKYKEKVLADLEKLAKARETA
jgi:hypothetical protein